VARKMSFGRTDESAADFDVIPDRRGLVGAACALALQGCGLRLRCRNGCAADPAAGWTAPRIYGHQPRNAAFLTRLGCGRRWISNASRPSEEMPYLGRRWPSHLDSVLRSGEASLGYIVESRLLQAGLWQNCRAFRRDTVSPARCARLELQDESRPLTLADDLR